jgi:hypothetical protein
MINEGVVYFLTCICIAGAFGGLLFGIRKNQVERPRFIDGNISLGFLGDFFFGVGGGVVIFLIIPQIPNINDQWGVVKLLALAIVGGYGGRALIEKVTNEHIDYRITLLEKSSKVSQDAYLLFSDVIDGKIIDKLIIRNTLINASGSILISGFALINDRRKALIMKLLDNEHAPESQILSIRKNFDALIPLLSVIIEREEMLRENEDMPSLHYHQASYAYLLKDQAKPQWSDALKHIGIAIELHKKTHSGVGTPDTYLFNKMLCNINLDLDFDARETFQELWNNESGQYEIMRSMSLLAPKLHEWVLVNYKDIIHAYFDSHKVSKSCSESWGNINKS